jgi:hypothetical protein
MIHVVGRDARRLVEAIAERRIGAERPEHIA